VSSAGISASWFPPVGGFRAKVEIQSKPTLTDSEAVLALVSPELFSTLHIPLLDWSVFNQTEVMNAAHVALVNQAFVKEYLADRNPLGQAFAVRCSSLTSRLSCSRKLRTIGCR